MSNPIQVYLSCFNEEGSISNNIHETLNAVSRYNCEVIVVDNASTDTTADLVKRLQGKYSKLRLIQLERNMGYSGSVFAAIKDAKAENIVILDGDLQFPPCYIEQLIIERRKGFELVFVERINLVGSPGRKIASRFFIRLLKILVSFPHRDINGGMRLLSRSFYSQISAMNQGRLANVELWWRASRNKIPYSFVPIKPRNRLSGKSSIPWRRPIKLLIESIVEIQGIKKLN